MGVGPFHEEAERIALGLASESLSVGAAHEHVQALPLLGVLAGSVDVGLHLGGAFQGRVVCLPAQVDGGQALAQLLHAGGRRGHLRFDVFALGRRVASGAQGRRQQFEQGLSGLFQFVGHERERAPALVEPLAQGFPVARVGKDFFQLGILQRRVGSVEAQHPYVELRELFGQLLAACLAVGREVFERALQEFHAAAGRLVPAGGFGGCRAGRSDGSFEAGGLRLGRFAAKELLELLAQLGQAAAHAVAFLAAGRHVAQGLGLSGFGRLDLLGHEGRGAHAFVQTCRRGQPVVIQLRDAQAEAVGVVFPFGEPARNRHHFVQIGVELRAGTVGELYRLLQFLQGRGRHAGLRVQFVQIGVVVGHLCVDGGYFLVQAVDVLLVEIERFQFGACLGGRLLRVVDEHVDGDAPRVAVDARRTLGKRRVQVGAGLPFLLGSAYALFAVGQIFAFGGQAFVSRRQRAL